LGFTEIYSTFCGDQDILLETHISITRDNQPWLDGINLPGFE
jgi:hypothetical protein